MEEKELRILTYNVACLPADVLPFTGGVWMGMRYGSKVCDPAYHIQLVQERRIRVFLRWLELLKKNERPHVICFQELMWEPVRRYAQWILQKKLGYETHPNIFFDRDLSNPLIFSGSGLAIYVDRRAGLRIENAWQRTFRSLIGLDRFTGKGMQAARVSFVHQKKFSFGVATTHPQAYQKYDDSPFAVPSEENDTWWSPLATWKMRISGVRQLKGDKIQRQHIAQMLELREFLDELKDPTQKECWFLAADLNINRWMPQPDSVEEKRATTAAYKNQPGAEFAQMLVLLKMQAPPISAESRPFSWDYEKNTLIPDREPAFQWIDYVLVDSSSSLDCKIRDATNTAVRIASNRPFPELSALWQQPCFQERQLALKKNSTQPHHKWYRRYQKSNRDYLERLKVGEQQLKFLVKEFEASSSSSKFTETAWVQFVQNAEFAQSSQIWKGLAFYGFLESDINLSAPYYHPGARPLKIGQPHGYRMICDASDHSAVLGRFLF